MPFGLGGPELILILVVILLLFGFKRLPDAARSLGRSMRIFKAEVDEMKHDAPPSAASRETVAGQTVPPYSPREESAPSAQPPAEGAVPPPAHGATAAEAHGATAAETPQVTDPSKPTA